MSNPTKNGMMLTVKIDVMKINRELLFAGKNGAKYLDMTVFIDNEKSDYGDNGRVVQDVGKERRQSGEKGAILGNCKILSGSVAGPAYRQQEAPVAQTMNRQADQAQRRFAAPDPEDDINF